MGSQRTEAEPLLGESALALPEHVPTHESKTVHDRYQWSPEAPREPGPDDESYQRRRDEIQQRLVPHDVGELLAGGIGPEELVRLLKPVEERIAWEEPRDDPESSEDDEHQEAQSEEEPGETR